MRYSTNLITAMLGSFFLLFLLLMGILAVEKLAHLVDLSLSNQTGMGRFIKLYLSILPSNIDNIIPVAVLTSVYFVLLRRRETREFVVLSSAGLSVWYLTRMLLVVGLIVSMFCLLISGFIKPYAAFSLRNQYQLAVTDLVARGLPSGQFFTQSDRVLYVTAAEKSNDRKIRLFSFDDQRLRQIFLSDCAQMNVVQGAVLSNICNGRMYLFNEPSLDALRGLSIVSPEADCRVCPDEKGVLDVSRLEISRSAFPFEMRSVFRVIKRESHREKSLLELLNTRSGKFSSALHALTAGKILLLAISSLFAVAIAILAVAYTNSKTRLIALPIAIAVEMTLVVVLVSGAIITPAMLVPPILMGFVTLLFVSALLSICLAAQVSYRTMIVPGLVRS